MRRRQLIEIHEQAWCPAILRDAVRAVLAQLASKLPVYEGLADELLDAMHGAGTREVVDLCAGAGGPWVRLGAALRGDARIASVLITDLFPDLRATRAMHRETDGLVRGHGESVDATQVPAELSGLRTLFAAFHHFDPERAAALLRDAAAAGRGIAIFELTQRRWLISLIIGAAMGPLCLAMVPFVRPVRLGVLLWTYVIPVIPMLLAFDGVISCLRSYTPAELEALGREAAPHYRWRAGVRRSGFGPIRVVFLIGVPPDQQNAKPPAGGYNSPRAGRPAPRS